MSQSVKHNLLAAFRHLLRPLVRIAIRNGIGFPEFAGVLQDAFVNVASSELRSSGRDVAADAISVMTGVSLADVQEVLHSPDTVILGEAQRKINAAARVLVGWHTDRDYIGPYGLVRDLVFAPTDSQSKKDVSGFAELANRYCPNVSPKALLDELIRTGCVQDLGNGFYRALTRSYVPEQLSTESIRRFAQVIHNVIETLEVNLRRSVRGTGRIERTIFADYGLPRNNIPAFDKYVRERGQLFADDIDNWLSDRSQQGHPDAVQTGIGFYHYLVNDEDERDFGKALQIEGTRDD
ncbi:MAG: DUF6502 family protein [Steroidobacteraceae bacterium]